MAQFNKITIIIFPATWLPREERRIKCILFWFCSFKRLIAQFNKSKIFQFPVTRLPHGEIRFLHPVSVFQSSERLIDGRKTPDYALYSELFTPELARQIVLGKLYIYSIIDQLGGIRVCRRRIFSNILAWKNIYYSATVQYNTSPCQKTTFLPPPPLYFILFVARLLT